MPRRPEEVHREIRRAESRLTKRLQRNPTLEEVAQETGLTPGQIRNALDAMGLAFAEELPDAEDPPASPADEAANRERAVIIEEAISRLPERQQEVIALYYWDGLTDKEIAARLRLSVSNATKTRQRAIEKLREQLGEG
jgi:DNA-directed RNA polymerase specialized sigma subunit